MCVYIDVMYNKPVNVVFAVVSECRRCRSLSGAEPLEPLRAALKPNSNPIASQVISNTYSFDFVLKSNTQMKCNFVKQSNNDFRCEPICQSSDEKRRAIQSA